MAPAPASDVGIGESAAGGASAGLGGASAGINQISGAAGGTKAWQDAASKGFSSGSEVSGIQQGAGAGVVSGNIIGGIGSAVGGGLDTYRGYQAAGQAVRAGHVRKGLEAGGQMAGGLGQMTSAGAQIAQYSAAVHGASAMASNIGGSVVPGVSVATGAVDLVRGGGSAIRAGLGRSEISSALENRGALASGVGDSLDFMHGVQGKVAKRGAINAVAGGLQVAGGVAALTGVGAGVGAGLAAAGTGIKAGRSFFGDLKQWLRDKAADTKGGGLAGRFGRFIGMNTKRTSGFKAQEMDSHVDRLIGMDAKAKGQMRPHLSSLGMGNMDLDAFENSHDLGERGQQRIWGKLKGLHMKRQGGDRESYGRGDWRENLFHHTLPSIGSKIANFFRRKPAPMHEPDHDTNAALVNMRAQADERE